MAGPSALLAGDKPGPAKPREELLELTLRILANYRIHCVADGDSSTRLALPLAMALLPLCVLSARKLPTLLRAGGNSTSGDPFQAKEEQREDSEILRRLLRMPIPATLRLLYPEVVQVPESEEKSYGDQPHCWATREACEQGQAYLLRNGLGTWLHLPRGESSSKGQPQEGSMEQEFAQLEEELPALLLRLRGEELLDPSQPEPVFPGDTAATLKPAPPKPGQGAACWREEVTGASLFIEDEGCAEMSYVKWMQYIQKQVYCRVDN